MIERELSATAPGRLQQIAITAAPVLLVAFSLAHGADWLMAHGMSDVDPGTFVEWMASIRRRWLAVHVAGLAVFPLVGLAVWWMLPPHAVASRISRVGLAIYILMYAAFDAMVGIGTAVLLEYREAAPVGERPVVDDVIVHLLMGSDTAYRFGEIASIAWGSGALAAAIALWNWRISLPLAAAGALLAWSHFPPFGAAAGAMLGLAAWQYLARERQAVSAGARA
jgi:hypothetical protein